MEMRTRLKRIFIIFFFTCGASGIGSAEESKKLQEKMLHILEILDLTEDQKNQIRQIYEISVKEIMSKKSEQKLARTKFQEAVQSNDVSDEALVELHEEYIQTKVAVMRARFDEVAKIRAVLNEKQREQYMTIKKKMKSQRGQSKGN